jgi:hypothetical protein
MDVILLEARRRSSGHIGETVRVKDGCAQFPSAAR